MAPSVPAITPAPAGRVEGRGPLLRSEARETMYQLLFNLHDACDKAKWGTEAKRLADERLAAFNIHYDNFQSDPKWVFPETLAPLFVKPPAKSALNVPSTAKGQTSNAKVKLPAKSASNVPSTAKGQTSNAKAVKSACTQKPKVATRKSNTEDSATPTYTGPVRHFISQVDRRFSNSLAPSWDLRFKRARMRGRGNMPDPGIFPPASRTVASVKGCALHGWTVCAAREEERGRPVLVKLAFLSLFRRNVNFNPVPTSDIRVRNPVSPTFNSERLFNSNPKKKRRKGVANPSRTLAKKIGSSRSSIYNDSTVLFAFMYLYLGISPRVQSAQRIVTGSPGRRARSPLRRKRSYLHQTRSKIERENMWYG
ncbi:hypothetical protein C8F04DRAFT_1178201 [Mycena alexandri]|uniref:Uncharacterized protein n=1 Tax=Mycena alexandri TaxID=1745969 RepID=A0AAD6T962_9AGAR|nr:hypothetical protein C8F04DRAFT_1178201 [Mycena alexandri]